MPSSARVVDTQPGIWRVVEDPPVGGHQRRVGLARGRDEQAVQRVGDRIPREEAGRHGRLAGQRREPDPGSVDRRVEPLLQRSREAQVS